jgi:NAD(P)-dependent dehydrogenase (short-subunit alcohol dehydrogenase family)
MWLISIRQLPRTRLPKFEIEGTATKLRVDVGKSSDVQALVTSTVERYGALDYAFNNAEPCLPPYHKVDSATLKRLQKL